jgi:hypothetical protein
MDQSRNKNNECGEILCVCMSVILFIATMVAFISAFVVWIIALVGGKNLDIPQLCPGNLLWEWLLVWGISIFIISAGYGVKQTRETETNVCKNICVFTILLIGNIALCWWGKRELDRDDGCIEANYGDTTFYRAATIIWWFDFVFVSLVTLVYAVAFGWTLMYLIILNCKCGRLCLNKMSGLTNQSADKSTNLIFDKSAEFDLPEQLSYSDNETGSAYSV